MDLSNFSNQLPTTGKPTRGLLVFLLMALPLVLPAQQEWQWGHAFGGIFGADEISDMVVDSLGNTYLIGPVGLGFTLEDSIYQGYGDRDMVLISYDCEGQLRWFEIMGKMQEDGDGPSDFYQLALGGNHLYVTGPVGSNGTDQSYYNVGDTVIKRATGVFNLFMRFDLEGNLDWVKVLGSEEPGKSWLSTIRHLNYFEDEVVVLVTSAEDSLEIDSGVVINSGFTALWFNTTGVYQRQLNLSPTYTNNAFTELIFTAGFEFMDGGAMVLGGYCKDDFSVAGQPRPAGAFVAKFSPQGQLQWLEGSEQGTTSTVYSMTFEGIAVNGDNVYACGGFVNGVVLFGDTINNKSINAGGTFIVVDFANQSYKITDHAWSVSKLIDIEYNSETSQLVTTGYITGTYIIDGDTIVGRTTYEPVVFFLNEDLELEEFLHLETDGNYDAGEKVRIDPNGNVYLAGVFSGSLYFDNDTLHKKGGGPEDIFIAKYGVEQCVDTSTGTQLPTLSTGAFGLLAWPNPAITHLTVKWQSETPGNHSLLLTDMQGRPVHREVVSGQSGTFRLSTASVSTGLYYLHLQGADGRQAGQMVVIQR